MTCNECNVFRILSVICRYFFLSKVGYLLDWNLLIQLDLLFIEHWGRQQEFLDFAREVNNS